MDPEHGYNVTGIPTDLLLLGFATLVMAIGGWMITELRGLRRDASARGRQTVLLITIMRQVCKKLGVPFDPEDANGNHD